MEHAVELPPGPVGPAPGSGPTDSLADLLLATLPGGMLLLSATGTVLHLNPQAAAWWGVAAADAQGQPLTQVGAGRLPELLYGALRRVAAGELQPASEYYLPAAGQWLAMTSRLLPAGTVVYWQDVTPQHQRGQSYQALADNSPDGLSRWSPQLQLLYANPAFAAQAGRPPAGQPGADSLETNFPAAVAAAWSTQLQQVFATGQPQELTGSWPAPAGERHYHARFVPELLGGRLATVLAISCDTTAQWHRQQAAGQARRRQQELARQTADKYRALCDSMSEGLCVLEPLYDEAQQPVDFRYLDVNPAFTRQTGLHGVVGKTIREVMPDLEPFWLTVQGQVARTGQAAYLEEWVASLGRWFALSAFALGPGPERHVAALFTDITDRKRHEANLAFLAEVSENLAQLTDPEATMSALCEKIGTHFGAVVCAFSPVDEAAGTVAVQYVWHQPGAISPVGVYRLDEYHSPAVQQAMRAGQPEVVPDTAAGPAEVAAYLAALNIRSFVNLPFVRRGEWLFTLSLTSSVPRSWRADELELLRELTARIWTRLERARAEAALAASEAQFRLLVTATSDVVYRMSADWTQMKQLVGKNFLADTQDPSSAWVTAYLPADDQAPVQAAIAEAIRHRRLFELEHRVQRADGTLGWVYSRAIPVLDAQGELTGWLGTARDVSARRAAAQQLQESASLLEHRVAERTQELQESRDLLHAIAEAQSAYVNAFKAIRDERGYLVDLEFIFVNSITTRVDGGRPLVGRRYLEAFPEAESSGLLDTFRRVIETGVGEDQEAFYDDGQLTGWFRNNATRLGDGVLSIGEDITARKLAEQERLRTLRLLEQAEQVASMGSWDYEPATGRLTWSAGMYRLFGLTAADPVGPDCYHRAAVPEDQPIAERLIRCLTAGTEPFEETLRLQIGEQVKTVRVRGVVPAREPSQPGRLLGVDLDISDVQRLETENLALRLDQQQALLLAILQAQETERSRLAESLHNGLGQVLYAIKLQLSQLDQPALHALPALDSVRAHADRLLADAIQQTRTISHELMPTRLLERSLATALRDICRDLTTPQLHFACHVWLPEPVLLPAPLQTALYRLAQELAHNVARHAQATQAALEFELLPGWAVLRAEDNGRGFDPAGTPHGLGLRLLHETVDLLGGTIALDSSPEYGTHIRLRIPLPPATTL